MNTGDPAFNILYGRLCITREFSWDSEQALEMSFRKWVVLRKCCEKGILVLDGDADTCGLCLSYKHCTGCPIREFTGSAHCYGTSFYDYRDAVNEENIPKALEAAKDMEILLEKIMEMLS